MNIRGQNFTNFPAVNLRGSIQIGLTADAAFGTLRADLTEGLDRAWTLPNKSGTLPIMGSFAIQLPAIAATTQIQSTIVTVTGVRAEDAITVQVNKGVTAGYGDMNNATSGGTSRILAAASPGNGNITLTFFNLGVATGYVELVCSYLAVR